MLAPPPDSGALRLGWQADLELGFTRRGEATVLRRNRHRGPLQVQKALYPENRDTCHVAILHPPGGIAAGDSLCVGVALDGCARALLTTPGATKWYRSEGDWARQALHFSLDEDAVLEWLPRENIFFDGSNIAMSLDVDLRLHAKYFGWDIFSFGRRASGEAWSRGTLRMRTLIRRADRVLWSEMANVDARQGFVNSAVGLAGFSVCGTFVVAGCEIAAADIHACRDLHPTVAESRVGVTQVPGVVIARYLGASTEEAFQWFTKLWGVLRPAVTGKSACPPRVWAC